jgi:hypothetical protein
MQLTFKDVDIVKILDELGMIGVIYGGGNQESSLAVMFPGEDFEGLDVLQMSLEEWQQFLTQSDVQMTEINAKAADGSIVKAMYRKSQRQIDTKVQWRVWKRDGYKCCYCGNADIPLTVDHLVLWEEGGPSTEENLLSACRKCNKVRGRTPYGDWLRHPYYVQVSQALTQVERNRNADVLGTLGNIRRVYVRSR